MPDPIEPIRPAAAVWMVLASMRTSLGAGAVDRAIRKLEETPPDVANALEALRWGLPFLELDDLGDVPVTFEEATAVLDGRNLYGGPGWPYSNGSLMR